MEHQEEKVVKHIFHDVEAKPYKRVKAERFCLEVYEDPDLPEEMPEKYYNFKLLRQIIFEDAYNPESGPSIRDLEVDYEDVEDWDGEQAADTFPMKEDWTDENIAEFVVEGFEQHYASLDGYVTRQERLAEGDSHLPGEARDNAPANIARYM